MNMIHRLSGNNAVSAYALSREVGIGQTTPSIWWGGTCAVLHRTFHDPTNRSIEVSYNMTKTPKSPKDWTPEQKMPAVLEA